MSPMDFEVSVADFERLERASSDEVNLELINGRIYVAPVPDGEHDEFIADIGEQIRNNCPELRLLPERGLLIPAYREGRARVDGAVAPRGYFRDQPPWSDPAEVSMVVEITSGRERDADIDRYEKRYAFADASIPTYLLVDRHKAEVTIFWEPREGDYIEKLSAKFGAPLSLPEPFKFDLDTAVLL
ncbi:Uma2 family endonuclease [Nocardia arthritidis]|nr:Uma2 family endonuclease [Nocardia arthritidis]